MHAIRPIVDQRIAIDAQIATRDRYSMWYRGATIVLGLIAVFPLLGLLIFFFSPEA